MKLCAGLELGRKWGLVLLLSTLTLLDLNLILKVDALACHSQHSLTRTSRQPPAAKPPTNANLALTFHTKPLRPRLTGTQQTPGGRAVTGQNRDRKSWFGFRGLELRSRDTDKRKTRPMPNAPRRRRLMKQPLRSSPDQHSKAGGFYPGHCRRATDRGSTTDSGLLYWRARLGPEECGEQCLVHMTSCLAQSWPENSEEAVKENLETKESASYSSM